MHMPFRAFLLFLLGAISVAAAALLAVGTRSALNRREDPVTVNAYVDGDRTPLAAHLPAYVRRVAVGDNQPVRRGDLVVELADDDHRAGLDQARSLEAQREVVAQTIGQAQAGLAAVEAAMPAIANELRRQQTLLPTLAGTRRGYEAAEADQARILASHAQAQAQLALRQRQREVL